MRAVLGIEDLSVYDVDPHAMEKFRRNLEPLGSASTWLRMWTRLFRDADIITTCTADKQQAKVLLDRQVKPGVHLNAIGGDAPARLSWKAKFWTAPPCLLSSRRRPALRARFSRRTRTSPWWSSGRC